MSSNMNQVIPTETALNQKLKLEVAIDQEIDEMSSRQTIGATTTLLLLPETIKNNLLVARFLFWQVVWKPLRIQMDWILDKDRNGASDFVLVPPFDSLTNLMQVNIDFFDDELCILRSFSTDPRLVGKKKIQLLRNKYDEYLFQFNKLKSLVKQKNWGQDLPSELSSNKSMMGVLLTKVEQNLQKKAESKRVSIRVRSIIAENERKNNRQAVIARNMQTAAKQAIRMKRIDHFLARDRSLLQLRAKLSRTCTRRALAAEMQFFDCAFYPRRLEQQHQRQEQQQQQQHRPQSTLPMLPLQSTRVNLTNDRVAGFPMDVQKTIVQRHRELDRNLLPAGSRGSVKGLDSLSQPTVGSASIDCTDHNSISTSNNNSNNNITTKTFELTFDELTGAFHAMQPKSVGISG
jgi:hypothetical protein